jgi:hypothetical protein
VRCGYKHKRQDGVPLVRARRDSSRFVLSFFHHSFFSSSSSFYCSPYFFLSPICSIEALSCVEDSEVLLVMVRHELCK